MIVEQALTFAEKDGFRFLELDIYRPDSQAGPLPLIHYVHGGGWRVSTRKRTPRETRGWDTSLFELMVNAGFVVAASDYRFSAEALYPAAIEDTLDAVTWLRANADQFGIDSSRVVVFGQSAGGYLAAAEGLADTIDPVQGVVCWYPLTDFSGIADDDPASGYPAQWLGAPLSEVPELVEQSRLPRLARPGLPPFLLQHGTADTAAPYDGSVRLHDALLAAGCEVVLETHEGAEHFFVGCDDRTVRGIFDRAMAFAQSCVSTRSA